MNGPLFFFARERSHPWLFCTSVVEGIFVASMRVRFLACMGLFQKRAFGHLEFGKSFGF